MQAENPENVDNMMRYGVEYQQKTEENFVDEHRQRMEKNLERREKEMGYKLVKEEDAPQTTTE